MKLLIAVLIITVGFSQSPENDKPIYKNAILLVDVDSRTKIEAKSVLFDFPIYTMEKDNEFLIHSEDGDFQVSFYEILAKFMKIIIY